jgi:hypothetical protein
MDDKSFIHPKNTLSSGKSFMSLNPTKRPLRKKLINSPYDTRFLYFHMLLRGRLQLGKVVSASRLCLMTIPLTFGVGWWLWFERAANEALFHLGSLQPSASINKHKWMRLIPGLHIFCIYSLAKLIRQMETLDEYRRTSPLLAALLAVQPSFAAGYLQSSLNHHWIQHVEKEQAQRLSELENRRQNS